MEQVTTNGRRGTDDARGLVELDETVPHVSEIADGKAVFDAAELTTRQINLELRSLVYDQGIRDVTIQNPGSRHSLGVGILARCRITVSFVGDPGAFRSTAVAGADTAGAGTSGGAAAAGALQLDAELDRTTEIGHAGRRRHSGEVVVIGE